MRYRGTLDCRPIAGDIDGHLEKLLSLPIAEHLAVNVNKSERERSGIILDERCPTHPPKL
jgi:hypothetical protein